MFILVQKAVMQTKSKIIPILILSALLLFAFKVNAEEGDRNPLVSSYLFHLYYDNGQLFADRDFEFKYDVIPEEYVPEASTTQFPFRGEIVNFKGEAAKTFQFDPRRGNPDFLKGKISVKAPYVSDGQKTVFYDSQDHQLLTIFVSESSFCNDDGVCNSNVGEDSKTCPNDCKVLIPPSPSAGPAPTGGGQGRMLAAAIYVLIILGAALGGWFGWKWWKGRQGPPIMPFPPTNLPPNLPMSQ